jgi:ribosomal-protein-alanine N-acetyltransferase
MVARPPVAIVLDRMKVEDLPAVHEIERESFSTPWPAHAYRQELETNRLAHYIVARWGDQIIGFAGIWLLVDEAHITTFAVRRMWRRHGVGERLLLALLDLARSRGAHEATLEVRPSNLPARRLYEKYGFKVVGTRTRYYSDDNEDALIMTTPSLDGLAMHERLVALRAAVATRPDVALGPDGRPIPPRAAQPNMASEVGPEDTSALAESAEATPDPGAEPRTTIRPSGISRGRP